MTRRRVISIPMARLSVVQQKTIFMQIQRPVFANAEPSMVWFLTQKFLAVRARQEQNGLAILASHAVIIIFFDKQNEETLCYSFTEWIKLVEKIGGAGYIDNKGDPQSCPEGTSPNTQTGFCELTCAEGEYVPAGDYVCRSCPAGYDCPGGTFNIIDYGNNQGVGDPIIYTITLNNYNNTATHQTIYEKYATGWYSNSGATTSTSTATVPSRPGYTFRGFYTSQQTDATSSGNTGTQRITKTGGLPSNTTFAANTTLYAAWATNCVDSSNCTLTVANNGAVTYTTSCPNGYVSGEGTYNPVCQSSSGNSNCSGFI